MNTTGEGNGPRRGMSDRAFGAMARARARTIEESARAARKRFIKGVLKRNEQEARRREALPRSLGLMQPQQLAIASRADAAFGENAYLTQEGRVVRIDNGAMGVSLENNNVIFHATGLMLMTREGQAPLAVEQGYIEEA